MNIDKEWLNKWIWISLSLEIFVACPTLREGTNGYYMLKLFFPANLVDFDSLTILIIGL